MQNSLVYLIHAFWHSHEVNCDSYPGLLCPNQTHLLICQCIWGTPQCLLAWSDLRETILLTESSPNMTLKKSL